MKFRRPTVNRNFASALGKMNVPAQIAFWCDRPAVTACIGMIIGALLCISMPLNAQESSDAYSTAPNPLFASDTPLSVRIEAPFTTLLRERPETLYLQGTFTLLEEDGNDQQFTLKVRARGKYRLQKDHCDFPPLRLNFRKREVDDTTLAGQDKLKLVTHCRTNSIRYEQLVYREHLAYRLLNLLTPQSYRVRLLRLEYVDTEGGDTIVKPGFVIEDDDDVAARNGLRVVKTGDVLLSDLDRSQQNLVNLFQYMIGNTEYSLFRAEPDDDCCHNSDLLSATGAAPYLPLPYDFDFAGIVNAPYAEPNPRYRLKTVRQRLYKGHCENNELLPDTIQLFLDQRDEMFAVVESLPQLSSISRRGVVSYLKAFFGYIEEPKSIKARLIERCVESPRRPFVAQSGAATWRQLLVPRFD